MRKPNLFIAGLPKSASTSFHLYLQQHPEVFMTTYKETNFFATDLDVNKIKDKETYIRLFSKATEKIVGESSVRYIYSKTAPSNIRKFNPKAKILLILREPVDWMYSWHAQVSLGPEVLDFESALRAEPDRKKDKNLSSKNWSKGFQYRELAKYSKNVERYFEVFGKKNVHVIIFDDIKKNPLKVYKEVCKFLKINQNFEPELVIHNPSKKITNNFVQKIFSIRNRPFVKSWVERLVPFKMRVKFGKMVDWLYLKPASRTPIDKKLQDSLKREFLSEVKKLSKLLQRDLVKLWGYEFK